MILKNKNIPLTVFVIFLLLAASLAPSSVADEKTTYTPRGNVFSKRAKLAGKRNHSRFPDRTG